MPKVNKGLAEKLRLESMTLDEQEQDEEMRESKSQVMVISYLDAPRLYLSINPFRLLQARS